MRALRNTQTTKNHVWKYKHELEMCCNIRGANNNSTAFHGDYFVQWPIKLLAITSFTKWPLVQIRNHYSTHSFPLRGTPFKL